MRVDRQKWVHHASRDCTIKSIWEHVRTTKQTVKGSILIWNRWHIPRHAFILWLASKNRLRTMDRVHNVGTVNRDCILCSGLAESHDHLFFTCRYSTEVWQEVASRGRLNWPGLPWDRAWEWAVNEFHNKNHPKHNIAGLIMAASVYHIWCERNRRLYNQVYCSVTHTRNEILRTIRDKLANLGSQAHISQSLLQ